jgi:hypothetical protein
VNNISFRFCIFLPVTKLVLIQTRKISLQVFSNRCILALHGHEREQEATTDIENSTFLNCRPVAQCSRSGLVIGYLVFLDLAVGHRVFLDWPTDFTRRPVVQCSRPDIDISLEIKDILVK